MALRVKDDLYVFFDRMCREEHVKKQDVIANLIQFARLIRAEQLTIKVANTMAEKDALIEDLEARLLERIEADQAREDALVESSTYKEAAKVMSANNITAYMKNNKHEKCKAVLDAAEQFYTEVQTAYNAQYGKWAAAQRAKGGPKA